MKVYEKLQVDHWKLNRMYRSYQLSEAQSLKVYSWDVIERLMKKRLISKLKMRLMLNCVKFLAFTHLTSPKIIYALDHRSM